MVSHNLDSPLRIGICGLGTVAQGLLSVLQTNHEGICARAGREIEVSRVSSRTEKPDVDLLGARFSTNLDDVINDPEIEVVVEAIGGEVRALEVIREALEAGKNVVTANKAVIAAHGDELLALARTNNLTLSFEAAVAGGIPIIAALTRSLTGNQIRWLAGIINGTSNYILTAMSEAGQPFEDALADAQALGYAEADPTFDVEGIDAAHKLTIMAALSFGIGFRFEDVFTEGIADLSVEDIEYAKQLGYRIKHLGIARAGRLGVELRVHPTLVPEKHLLANIEGVMNAVVVNGNASGETLYYGAGAGSLPTASSVAADLIEIARDCVPEIVSTTTQIPPSVTAMEDVVCGYYLKIPSLDKPGVFARVATVLSDHQISIEAAIQKEQAVHTETQQAWVPIIILTQQVRESTMNDAIASVQELPEIVGEIKRIRVEHLSDD